MHILALEAYDGGSHKQFLDGLIANSRHNFARYGLPARKWKWRMRGAAIYFARLIEKEMAKGILTGGAVDLIFTSDMTSVADLKALLPESLMGKPIICYFHENQLTYPLVDDSERDFQYGFTNITSCLAANEAWFNSRYHLDSFLQGVKDLLRKMPDYVPENITNTIINRSKVMPLGLSDSLFVNKTNDHQFCRESSPPTVEYYPPADSHPPPTLLWNHRWEYDKNPEEFFEVLFDLDRTGVEFRLIVAGENFRTAPPIFEAARKTLTANIVHFGYVENRGEYEKLLVRSDIVVSTARHEFYGLSVLEAMAARCYPLLPNRLSYPGLIPVSFHQKVLYDSPDELRGKLISLCHEGIPYFPAELTEVVSRISWSKLIASYDAAFEIYC
ncbi:MAG: DUF3524 domain-containing protein [Planctomycetes bacterium]|nr:DUF3524 domain-containing protein [Planctomycetota bacterium]